jgi:hypothetical protein
MKKTSDSLPNRDHTAPRGDLGYYISLSQRLTKINRPAPKNDGNNRSRLCPESATSKIRATQITTAPAVLDSEIDLEKLRKRTLKDFRNCWISGEISYATTNRSIRTIQLMQEEPMRFRRGDFEHVDMLDKYRHFEWYDKIREESKKKLPDPKEIEKNASRLEGNDEDSL